MKFTENVTSPPMPVLQPTQLPQTIVVRKAVVAVATDVVTDALAETVKTTTHSKIQPYFIIINLRRPVLLQRGPVFVINT